MAQNELVNVSGSAKTEGLNAFLRNSGAGRITRALVDSSADKGKFTSKVRDVMKDTAGGTSHKREKKRKNRDDVGDDVGGEAVESLGGVLLPNKVRAKVEGRGVKNVRRTSTVLTP